MSAPQPGYLYIKVDANKVKLSLQKRIFKRSGEPNPNLKYLVNTQHATILQMNYILRGLANYYKLDNNFRHKKW